MVPFWRGEQNGRTYDLGRAIGEFLRELRTRLDTPDRLEWLQREFFVDANAARNGGTATLPRTATIAVARDHARSSRMIKRALVSGLISAHGS